MNIPVKALTTFAIAQSTRNLIKASSTEQLFNAWREARDADLPVLILGGGSNVLFVEDFQGTVILNRIMGVTHTEAKSDWRIHVAAGENWHQLLEFTLVQGMAGLENLALIPGCVGSAPIQNIGAYGVELKQYCDYVDCLELATGRHFRLSACECRFGYRDSIFKHELSEGYAITAVGLRLNKHWQPVLDYGELSRLDHHQVTPRQIFEEVCRLRRSRLPDPALLGNAGSFFKNPVVTAEQAQCLLENYPQMPNYSQPDGGVKLAAGWLIDQCQLKGYRIGDAAVHEKQALVLVNLANATGRQVLNLAHYVRQRVGEKFDVWLEPEVRFIGAKGEIDAVGAII